MSLMTALGLLAALVLVAIAVHGLWSARGGTPRAASPVPAAPAAVDRVEPPLDTVPGPLPPEALRLALRRVPRLDALIDALVTLTLDTPVSGDFLLTHLPDVRRAGSKPVLVEGLDSQSGEWEPLQPGHRYGELLAGVQLANRSGPLNEIEYSEFVQKIQGFAEAVGALPDFPDMLDVVARARELDTFASARDAQLTLTLRSDAVAWSVGYIQQCAARQGFVPGVVPGRLVRPAVEEGDPPLLVLSFDSQAALADDPQKAAVRECQLSLDVPQTAAAAEPFPAWHDAARQLADDMAASLVDDYGEPITLHAFAGIGRELDQLYRQLEARDLAAGSTAARRLFSG
jgi:hypothetical protein